MKCKYCNSEILIVKENGPHNSLYCYDCKKFQKHLSKKEMKLKFTERIEPFIIKEKVKFDTHAEYQELKEPSPYDDDIPWEE